QSATGRLATAKTHHTRAVVVLLEDVDIADNTAPPTDVALMENVSVTVAVPVHELMVLLVMLGIEPTVIEVGRTRCFKTPGGYCAVSILVRPSLKVPARRAVDEVVRPRESVRDVGPVPIPRLPSVKLGQPILGPRNAVHEVPKPTRVRRGHH